MYSTSIDMIYHALRNHHTRFLRRWMNNVFLIVSIGFCYATVTTAQTATATWTLISDTAVSLTGNIQAPAQVLTMTKDTAESLSVKDYAGGAFVGAAERIWLNGAAWPNENSKNPRRYIEYSVSPKPGYTLTVQSITLNLGCSGTSKMYASISCSTDSSFLSYTTLYSAAILPDVRTASFAALSFTPGTVVNEGKTFTMRIYPWFNTTPSATKYICLSNVVMSGTSVGIGMPSLTVLPASLSFGTMKVNTSKDLSLTISGTFLAPAHDSIHLSCPAGFGISTFAGSGYSSSVAVPYSGSTVSVETVFVRFMPSSVQTYQGNIVVTGGGVPQQSIAVTGDAVASNAILGIFVSPGGNDSDNGTYNHPYLTIQKAVSVAQIGDTIFVRGGTYALGTTLALSSSGLGINNKRCLFAFNHERPILDFSSMAYGSSNKGVNVSGSYWHIKGFDIYKAGDNGMNITGSNNVVECCALYENQDSGLQLSGTASNNRIINCDSYFNYDAQNSGGNADGFSPKQLTGTNNYFYGCRAWQNSDDGWDCFEAVASVTIENCWTMSNGYLKDGITTSPAMNGNGFKLGGNYTENDATLIHCLAFANKDKGFDQNHNRGSMSLIHCTGTGNIGYNYSITETLDSGKILTFTNCVELGNKRNIGSFAVLTTNSWPRFSAAAADFTSLDTAGVRGPRKADGSLPDINFMHLARGSRFIDAGSNVGLPFYGAAPDLGYVESNYPASVELIHETSITGFQLLQNYPNPFNPSTVIHFSVATLSSITLRVFDLLGREVAVLVHGTTSPGSYSLQWNAEALPSGIYFYQLTSGGNSLLRKMILMK